MKRTMAVTAMLGAAIGFGSLSPAALAESGTGVMMLPSEIRWEPFFGGVLQIAKLWGDRDKGASGILIKFPGGFKAPDHAHTHAYNGLTLEGIWVHTMNGVTRELPPGSYVHQPGGDFHGDGCKGPEPCVIFLQQDAAADFIPEKQ